MHRISGRQRDTTRRYFIKQTSGFQAIYFKVYNNAHCHPSSSGKHEHQICQICPEMAQEPETMHHLVIFYLKKLLGLI
jgi:hypothetical protein